MRTRIQIHVGGYCAGEDRAFSFYKRIISYESQNMELHTPLPLLNSTSIPPVAGPPLSYANIYPVMRATASSASASGVLNLSQPCEKANQLPSFLDNTGCMETVLKAIKAFKVTVLTRFEHLDKYVGALDDQLKSYRRDVLLKTVNQSPTKIIWKPWFRLKNVDELNAMEVNLQNENLKAAAVSCHSIYSLLLGSVCLKNAFRSNRPKDQVLPTSNDIRQTGCATVLTKIGYQAGVSNDFHMCHSFR
ncbi:unnamed protein product [Calicophoron daubneyi]|uniref:Uncharacterized protein n=1 Tax=Calicophoron daubneyi TaxID=300641 RepID=A0AAV2T939_CALDB